MKTKYKDYDRWYLALRATHPNSGTLREYTLVFHNKEHFERYSGYIFSIQPKTFWINELLAIKTYGDALLYKNSENIQIREICNYIIKGDIEIYD